jgi:hypothetical protein
MGDEMEPEEAAVEAKAASLVLREHRRQLKLRRMKKEAKAAERKATQKKRVVEEETRKRQRTKVTINSYFMTTRNVENKGDLDQVQGCENNPDLRRRHRGGRRHSDRRGSAAHGASEDDAAATSLLDLGGSSLASVDAETASMRNGVSEGETVLELSIPPVLSVSSDSSRYVFSEDDPSFVDPHDKVPSGSNLDVSSEDSDFDDLDLQLERRKKLKDSMGKRKVVGEEKCAVGSKKWKSRYDLTQKFQLE